MKATAKILLIDAERQRDASGLPALMHAGHTVVCAANEASAEALMRQQRFDLIIIAVDAPDVDALHLVQRAVMIAPRTPVLATADAPAVATVVRTVKAGALDVLEKPVQPRLLLAAVQKALQRCQLDAPNVKFSPSPGFFGDMIGRSRAMQDIFAMIASVAETDANVLITGESGTGKELVARSLHALSRRRDQPFVPVNCSALPEALFEAELFGYEKGAFTGAVQRKLGLVEIASGGSFFLDEVCELPVHLQVKLLRVLQERQLRHIGGTDQVDIDVRLIAAANGDLDAALEDGRMRRDFYFRINVVNIHVPPLRERRDDIRLLANYFLQTCLKSSPKAIAGFEDEVLARFERYDWPGNVRELENTVERAVALAPGEMITMDDLPPVLLEEANGVANGFSGLTLTEAREKALQHVEQKYLLELLATYRGNVTKIARVSGMTRRNLHRLLKRHRLDARAWRQTC